MPCRKIASCDVFIMNAAVADFRISSDTVKKVPKSEFENFLINNIELVPDILKNVSKAKKQNQIFIGFCAFSGSFKSARKIIKEKIMNKGCDFLFANPIDIEGQGFGSLAENEGWLFSSNGTEKHLEKTLKINLANELINQIISFEK